jgi:hypothetical protein
MRTFVLFALALAGLAVFTDDTSAGPFRRNRGYSYAGSGYGSSGTYGGTYAGSNPCCDGATVYNGSPSGYVGGSGSSYTGPYFDGRNYYVPGTDGRFYPTTAGATTGGMSTTDRPAVIQTTDGQSYTLGQDGNYYPSSSGRYTGFATQPYAGSMYRGYSTYYPSGRYYPSGTYYPSGVYPAGYTGPYNGGVYPAGGPLTMPAATVPGQMPPKK